MAVFSKISKTGQEKDILILVTGPIGSGKSSIINFSVGNHELSVKNDSSAGKIIATFFPPNPDPKSIRTSSFNFDYRRVILIDTPAINDPSTTTVPKQLTKWLEKSYPPGKKLSAVIYMHRIDSPFFDPSLAQQTLNLFQNLFDKNCLRDGRVCLVTNFFGDTPTATDREMEWKIIGARGAWTKLCEAGAQYHRMRCYDMPSEQCVAQNKADEIIMGVVVKAICGEGFSENEARLPIDKVGVCMHQTMFPMPKQRVRPAGKGQVRKGGWKSAGAHEGDEAKTGQEKYQSLVQDLIWEIENRRIKSRLRGGHEEAAGDEQDIDSKLELPVVTELPQNRRKASQCPICNSRRLIRSIRSNPSCLDSTEEASIVLSPALSTPIQYHQFNPLWDAVATGQHRKVRRVLGTPLVQVDRKLECGTTPLMKAVWDNAPRIVAMLLKAGASPTRVKDKHGNSALHLAAFVGDYSVTKLLIKHENAEVDTRNYGDTTPLHVASICQHSKIVRMLLDSGADLSLRNGMGRTPMYYAVVKENWEIAGMLMRAGAKVDEDWSQSLTLGPNMLLRLVEPRGTDMVYKYWNDFMKLLGDSDGN